MTVSSAVDLGCCTGSAPPWPTPLDAASSSNFSLNPPTRASWPTASAPPGRTCPTLFTCLRGCGLVAATAEGRRIRYDLADPRLGDALRLMASLDLPGTCDT